MTYSIVACDDDHLGVATASHWLAVGALVPWCEAGVGAVATQAFTEPAHGPRALAHLRSGGNAPTALAETLRLDERTGLRQVAVIDTEGRTAHHTGAGCFPDTSVGEGNNAIAVGNMLTTREVPHRMIQAFTDSDGGLAERLTDALAAGDDAGGDARGRQAAALVVVQRRGRYDVGTGTVVDLRIDDHPQPVTRLREMLRLQQIYDAISRAVFPSHGGALDSAADTDLNAAAAQLDQLAAIDGGDAAYEAALWLAVCHLRADRPDEARAVLRGQPALFALAHSWNRFLERAGRHIGLR